MHSVQMYRVRTAPTPLSDRMNIRIPEQLDLPADRLAHRNLGNLRQLASSAQHQFVEFLHQHLAFLHAAGHHKNGVLSGDGAHDVVAAQAV